MPRVPPQKMLLGQKALVTGASSGIGRAIAQSLAEAGAEVVVNYASGMDKAVALVEEIRAKGGRAIALKADVSDEGQVREMFRAAIAELGTLDILINNAGLQQDAPFHELTLAQWNRVIGVNLTGQFLCAREAVREFMRRGVKPEVSCAAGKIICVSSVHEVIPWAGHVNYAASKGGVMLMKLIPYKRIGEVEDIGRAAVWLSSDYSDYVHGTSLFIDGGMTLYPGFETGG
jgi:glucose 1-dehydrogenase